jgi:hypothetical protein
VSAHRPCCLIEENGNKDVEGGLTEDHKGQDAQAEDAAQDFHAQCRAADLHAHVEGVPVAADMDEKIYTRKSVGC